MAQHDNGRRPGGTPSGAWQQGHREQQDHPSNQQDQSVGGRYGAQQGGGQQGGQRDAGASSGHQVQYDPHRSQQGDNWRERPGPAAGGWRPAMEERDRGWGDRGGQGSFGGQASDNDYGNRGITESGDFGNDGGARGDAYGTMSGRGRGDHGGQGAQRLVGYSHGYDARSDAAGGYGSSDFGADSDGRADWNAQRAWRDEARSRDFARDRGRDAGATYGQSSADNYQGGRSRQGGPSNRDHYGDNGYQGNWTQGQRGQAYHDPDYHQWRTEQVDKLDRDYDEWRQHRYQRFAEDFDNWRANRDNNPGSGTRAGSAGASASASAQGGQPSAPGDISGQQGGTSRHDVAGGGDKGAGKTATK